MVQLRFFVGMTIAQAAETLGLSDATVERSWTFARTWLFSQIQEDLRNSPDVRENPLEYRL